MSTIGWLTDICPSWNRGTSNGLPFYEKLEHPNKVLTGSIGKVLSQDMSSPRQAALDASTFVRCLESLYAFFAVFAVRGSSHSSFLDDPRRDLQSFSLQFDSLCRQCMNQICATLSRRISSLKTWCRRNVVCFLIRSCSGSPYRLTRVCKDDDIPYVFWHTHLELWSLDLTSCIPILGGVLHLSNPKDSFYPLAPGKVGQLVWVTAGC